MGLYPWSASSVIRAKRERDNCTRVSRDMSTFSTSNYMHSYSSDMPNILRPKISNRLPNFGTPPQRIQRGNAWQPVGPFEFPYGGLPETILPFPTTNISLHDWQQSASLPQDSLGPHPQSRVRVESDPLRISPLINIVLGQSPEAGPLNIREVVDASGRRLTMLPPK